MSEFLKENIVDYDRIRSRLVVVVEEYVFALTERNSLREAVNTADNSMKIRRLAVLDEVSRELDSDGKKRFGNDAQREAETQRRIEKDQSFIDNLQRFVATSKMLSEMDARVLAVELECKNLRCVLDSMPQTIQLRTRG